MESPLSFLLYSDGGLAALLWEPEILTQIYLLFSDFCILFQKLK